MVFLSGLDIDVAIVWVNILLHYIAPVYMLVDWILFPPYVRLKYIRSLWWLVFPLGYVVYSLVRGLLVDWYPYPFLDPTTNGGYFGVAVFSGAVFVTAVMVSGGLVRLQGYVARIGVLPKK